MDTGKFATIDARQCHMPATFAVAKGDNGAQTWAVEIKARDALPIDHPWWGRIVHDLAGMQWRKSRLAIDWSHTDTLLGYVDHHEIREDGLYLQGQIVPKDDNDQASQVVHYLQSDIPLEASIDFGDEMELAFVPPHETATINGHELDGEEDGIVIVSSWFLRRIAICPSGADPMTETAKQWADGRNRTITPRISPMTTPTTETAAMSKPTEPTLAEQLAAAQAALDAKTDEATELAAKLEEAQTALADAKTEHATKLEQAETAAAAALEVAKTEYETKLAAVINGNSKPVGVDGSGDNAEPATWAAAVERFGYAEARKKFPQLRAATIK